jgi:hypothetical protein
MKRRLRTEGTELLGLLQELASKPGARALREAASSRPGRSSVQRLGAISDSALERHIFAERRDELSALLQWACLDQLYSVPSRGGGPHHGLTATRQLQLPTRRAWRARTTLRLRGTSERGPAIDLLSACLGRRSASASELALAALHITPRDGARINLGLALTREGRLGEARTVLTHAAQIASSELCRSIAFENLGQVLGEQGRFDAACDAFERSALAREERPSAAFGWLLTSVLSLRVGAARKAAALLQEVAHPQHPTLLECLEANSPGRRWKATAPAIALARKLETLEYPVARKALHVLR